MKILITLLSISFSLFAQKYNVEAGAYKVTSSNVDIGLHKIATEEVFLYTPNEEIIISKTFTVSSQGQTGAFIQNKKFTRNVNMNQPFCFIGAMDVTSYYGDVKIGNREDGAVSFDTYQTKNFDYDIAEDQPLIYASGGKVVNSGEEVDYFYIEMGDGALLCAGIDDYSYSVGDLYKIIGETIPLYISEELYLGYVEEINEDYITQFSVGKELTGDPNVLLSFGSYREIVRVEVKFKTQFGIYSDFEADVDGETEYDETFFAFQNQTPTKIAEINYSKPYCVAMVDGNLDSLIINNDKDGAKEHLFDGQFITASFAEDNRIYFNKDRKFKESKARVHFSMFEIYDDYADDETEKTIQMGCFGGVKTLKSLHSVVGDNLRFFVRSEE